MQMQPNNWYKCPKIIFSPRIQTSSGESDEVPCGGKRQRKVPWFDWKGQPLHLPPGHHLSSRVEVVISTVHLNFQDPDQMNQSLMKLLQIMKMIYQVRKNRGKMKFYNQMQNGNTLCWLRCQASTTRQRGLPRSWWRSQTKWFAAARGSSPRVAVSLSGTRLLVQVDQDRRVSSGAGSDWEQADPVHPVEYRLQGGVPEDQEQEGANGCSRCISVTFSQGREEGKGVQFQREIHLWTIWLLLHETEVRNSQYDGVLNFLQEFAENVLNDQPVHKSLQQQNWGLWQKNCRRNTVLQKSFM